MKKKMLLVSVIYFLLSGYALPLISYADELMLPEDSDFNEEEDPSTEVPVSSEDGSSLPEDSTSSSEEDNNSTNETQEIQDSESPVDSSNDVQEETELYNVTEISYDYNDFSIWNQGVEESEVALKLEKNEQTELFIRKIGEIARKIGQKENLYASVMIAQAILETGSGDSELSQSPYYNIFGIKGEYEEQFVEFLTYEDDGSGKLYQVEAKFKQYPSYKESFEDYAKLLKEGIDTNKALYEKTWKDKTSDYKEATEALTGTYATDTSYNKKLNALIETYGLVEYDQEKSTKNSEQIIVTDSHPDSDFKPYFGESYSGAQMYATGNCTQYVYNRIVNLEGFIETTMGNGADWGNVGKSLGYEVSNTPKSGTAVSFQPGVAGADSTYGHVAFVEHLYQDGSILISEMNVSGLGEVSFRVIDQQTAKLLTYITPK